MYQARTGVYEIRMNQGYVSETNQCQGHEVLFPMISGELTVFQYAIRAKKIGLAKNTINVYHNVSL